MAETAISAVLSKLGELAISEARILLQVHDDIVLLRDRLEWLQAFVRDADRRRRAGTDGLTRVWVCQTRDVAFDAEDALDEFFYEEVCPSVTPCQFHLLSCSNSSIVPELASCQQQLAEHIAQDNWVFSMDTLPSYNEYQRYASIIILQKLNIFQ